MAVTNSNSQSNLLVKISFYLLCALLLITPLIFSEYFFSGFDLVKNSSIQIVGGLFIILFSIYLLFTLFRDKQYSLFIDRSIDPFIILFVIGLLFSTIFSLNQYVSFYGTYTRQIGFITFIYLFFIYFFSSQIFKDEDRINNVLKIIEITAILVSVYSILQALQLDPFGIHIIKENGQISSRPVTSLGHPNFAAGLLILVIPFSLVNLFKNKLSLLRLLIPVVLTAGIFVTQSRGAYAAFIVELFLFFLLYPVLIKQDKKQSGKILKTGLAVLALIAVFIISLLFFFPDSSYALRLTKIPVYDPRWLLWRDSMKLFLLYPLTGTGTGLFPTAFENVITNELRRAEILSYYDNPHNNFINILCTAGIFGFISYILLLGQGIRLSLRSLKNNLIPEKQFFYYSVFISICGYIAFGVTNFDDITILLYLFIIFALLKASISKNIDSNKTFTPGKFKLIIIPTLCILLIFCGYNIFRSYINLKADRSFQEGAEPFSRGDFRSSVNFINEAVTLNSGCPDYKYTLANNTYIYTLQAAGLKPEMKTSLLNQAKDELMRAEVNYHSKIECRKLLSLIYYEMGNNNEADKIRNEIISKDTFNVIYRIDLAMHYIKIGDLENAEKNLEIAHRFAPEYSSYYIILIKFWEAKSNTVEVKKACYELLRLEPGNQFAISTLGRLK